LSCGASTGCSDVTVRGGDCGEASREPAKKTAGRKTRMKLSLNLVKASPGRNAHTFCEGSINELDRAEDAEIARRFRLLDQVAALREAPSRGERYLARDRPLGTKFFGAADDAFDEIAVRLFLRGSIRSGAVGRISSNSSFSKTGFHGAVWVTEEFGAADMREDPAHALEDGLAVHVLGKFFERMIAVAIALDGKAVAVAFDNQVDFETRRLAIAERRDNRRS